MDELRSAKAADIGQVVDTVERVAALGWSLGHPTDEPGVLYWPIPPLGVVYRLHGRELIVIRVVAPRAFRRPIGSRDPYEPPT